MKRWGLCISLRFLSWLGFVGDVESSGAGSWAEASTGTDAGTRRESHARAGAASALLAHSEGKLM